MKRREFIGLVGGAAMWPLAARAQQASMPVVGFLRSTPLDDAAHLVTAFRQGLEEAGFVEGQNVIVEYRSAEAHRNRLTTLVADLVRRPVAVIVCNGEVAPVAKDATTTVPIVFGTGTDPVRGGLVDSLNRPGGNVTGVIFFSGLLSAKRLELLRQLAPQTTAVAMLVNPGAPDAEAVQHDAHAAAQAVGQQLTVLNASSEGDIERAFATLVEPGAVALQIGSGALFNSQRELIVALAAGTRYQRSITGVKRSPSAA